MGNINTNNILCNHNLYFDDLYEVDWFSKNNWQIYLSNEEYRKNIIIKKGKITLSNINNLTLTLQKKIKISEKNIKKLLMPLFFDFNSNEKFNILIQLSNNINKHENNDDNNDENNDENKKKNFFFNYIIKCKKNNIYLNDNIFEKSDKNKINILFNFEYNNILSSSIDFIQSIEYKEDIITHIIKTNNLYYINEEIYLNVIIKINKLNENEYIKLNL
jgi:hypothetical protein